MAHHQSTKELVEAYRLGDQDAARELHKRFVGLLYPYARGCVSVRNRYAIDVSGVLLSAFWGFLQWVRKPGKAIEDTAHAVNLLKRMVKWRIINEINNHPDPPAPLQFDLADAGPAQWEKYQQLLDEIERFLAGWGDWQRETVRLRLEEHTIAQIANRVGKTPGRVKSILQRFRDQFGRWRQRSQSSRGTP